MAFIVETGAIVANANSYASVAEFEAYWTDRNIDITAETDAAKQAALIKGTQFLDNNAKWKGLVKDVDQPLDWPRNGVYDDEMRDIDDNVIPKQLKYALFEYAYRQLTTTDGIQPDVTDEGTLKSTTKRVGDLQVTMVYQDKTGGYYGLKSYPEAEKWLTGITVGGLGGSFGRGVRI